MFLFAYVILLVIAAIPLAITTARRRTAGPTVALAHRMYRDLAYVAAAVVAIVAFELALRISLDAYWFSEVGQSHRYWFAVGLQAAIFATILLVGGAFLGFNLRLASADAALPRSLPWIAGFLIAALLALGATWLWAPLTAFLGRTPSGVVDPLFGADLAFWLLTLPFLQAVLSVITTFVVIAILAWAVLGFVLGPWRRLRRRFVLIRDGAGGPQGAGADLARFFERGGGGRPSVPPTASAGPWPSTAWVSQGMALGALWCLTRAAARGLARYDLAVEGHSRVVAGASWIDVHLWLGAYAVIILVWLAAAALLAIAAFAPRFRRALFQRPRRWVAAVAALAALWFAAEAIPAIVENLYVGPNQITLEQPYLVRSIGGTRRAFALEGPNVDEQMFPVSAKPIGRDDLAANDKVLRDARIWDWRALEPQLQQTQGLRPYYTFSDVDIDRYQVDGEEREVMLTPRELDLARLPAQAQVWVNQAIKYTHGYGVVAVPVGEIDDAGNPVLWAHDIPIQAKDDLAVTHGEIYYGLLTRDRVYVRTTEKEFDFPRGDANAETTYGGAGGIPLSNLWRKLVVARAFDGLRVFISGYFTPQSRVLIRRNVVERVWRLAPFLSFDRDPYIVADGDHYSWIVDGYTTSSNYPYSEAYRGSVPAFSGRNYLRNSVKAVVDAYNGTVTLYDFAPDDPIIRAWRKMLPGLFKDAAEMPPALRRHIRYPEDLFTAQAEMYGTYHMTNPTTFYNREDRWEVPHELYRDAEVEVQPYYVMAQLQGEQSPEFVLMLPLAVAGKNQMAGWLAGRCDGANYGKLVAYRFPKGHFIDGPAQVESRISSDSRFSGDLTLWDQHGSTVIRGNLIILPLGRQLAAIEPVYIEAEQTKIPNLARVVFGQLLPDDRRIEWAPTLAGAEDLLVGTPGPESGATSPGATTPAGAPPPPATGDALARARQVFGDMQRAYAAGDFVRYGQLMAELGRILAP
ncbi:MAG TPA: UPF0182 family protein [Caulobacteraceae bacterium]|nr:UPF0182 family protein [Caulobacteraceae bacterium]